MPDFKKIHPRDYRRIRAKAGRSPKRINRLYQRVLDGKLNLTWLKPLSPHLVKELTNPEDRRFAQKKRTLRK